MAQRARAAAVALVVMLVLAAPALADTNTGGTAAQPAQPQTAPDPAPVHAALASDGLAVVPAGVPVQVAEMIEAANRIARKPYVWGGGHAHWRARGYDCSGAVSYILHSAGLLDRPLVSGLLARFGLAGPGQWLTIYANRVHTFLVIDGLRFDTGHPVPRGTSHWSALARPTRGFRARHILGL